MALPIDSTAVHADIASALAEASTMIQTGNPDEGP